MSYLKLEAKGNGITDSPVYSDRLRDMNAIIAELKEVHENFSTHSMNETGLALQGMKIALGEVIEYLERV